MTDRIQHGFIDPAIYADLRVPHHVSAASVCPDLSLNTVGLFGAPSFDAFDDLPSATRAALLNAKFDRDAVGLAFLWLDRLMTDTEMACFVRTVDMRETPFLTLEAYGADHPSAPRAPVEIAAPARSSRPSPLEAALARLRNSPRVLVEHAV